jgi:RNA polymerase sigma-70 factor, ECF subfamily
MDHTSEVACAASVTDSTIAGFRSGDAKTWAWMHEHLEGPLKQVASRNLHRDLRTKVGISDIVQDTFLLAHRSANQFRGASLPEMTAWLKRILRNQIARTVRDQRWTQKRALHREVRLQELGTDIPLGIDAPTPSQVLQANEERELLDRALTHLPPADRQLIVEHYVQRISFAELAQRSGKTEAAIRKQWSRAMTRWKLATKSLQNDVRDSYT